jgi:hypothetical protein
MSIWDAEAKSELFLEIKKCIFSVTMTDRKKRSHNGHV